MSRTRWMSLGVGLAVLVLLASGWQGLRGQTGKKAAQIRPEHCFSAETVVYLRVDGTKTHQAEWEKTAAYSALVKSGLAQSIDDWLSKVGAQQEQVETFRVFLWQALENGFSVGVVPPENPETPEVNVTIVLHNGAGLYEDLAAMIPPQANAQQELLARNGKEVSRTVIVAPADNFSFTFWPEGDHLVITAGSNPAATLDVLDGKANNITSDPNWKRRNALDKGQTLTGVAWIDFAKLFDRYQDLELPPGGPGGDPVRLGDVLRAVGVENLTEIIGRQGYEGKACVSRVDILHDGPRHGLLTLLEGDGMTLDKLPPLPKYSTSVLASSTDCAIAYDAVLDAIRNTMNTAGAPDEAKQQFENALAQADEFVGGSVRDDVLANLGPVHALFSDPTNGIGGFGFGYAVQVRHPDKLREILDSAVQHIPEPRNANDPQVIRNEKDGREFISFGQPGIPFFPTMTIGDDWLIVGLSSQTVDAFLERQAGELEKWSPSDELQPQLDKLPKEFVSLTITDPRETIRTAMQYLPFLEGVMANSPNMAGIPMIDLPSADRIVRSMFPSAYVATVDDAGIHYQGRSSLPGLPLIGSPDGVSMGTVAVGVALLLPAVQQAREAARRAQSSNNLKQLMLAMHNYHDANKEFPAGVIDSKRKPEESLSWLASILPYVDQAALYDNLDDQEEWDSETNAVVAKTVIPIFINPSAAEVDLDGYARTDYAGVAGLGKDGPDKDVGEEGAGIFAYHRGTNIADITDGTSNTIAIGEVIKDRGPWLQGGPGTIRPFIKQPYINGPDGWGGNHVGGSYFGFADGSVRFISENIDPKTLEALVTIQGGEVLGDF